MKPGTVDTAGLAMLAGKPSPGVTSGVMPPKDIDPRIYGLMAAALGRSQDLLRRARIEINLPGPEAERERLLAEIDANVRRVSQVMANV